MFTRLSIAVACSLALVAAGCGSSSKSSKTTSTTTATPNKPAPIAVSSAPVTSFPKPTESLSAFEKRLTAAAHAGAAGNCAATAAFAKSANLSFPCKGKARKALANYKVTGDATYGTGAVVDFTTAGDSHKHPPGFREVKARGTRTTGVYPLALSTTGHYTLLIAGNPPVFPGSYIGTKPNGWAGADAEAVKYLTAVRDNNCATWFKNIITPNGMPKKTACQLGLAKASADLRNGLNSGQPIKLSREDGNGVFYYYSLTIGKKTGTLGVARDQPPAPSFIALGVAGGK